MKRLLRVMLSLVVLLVFAFIYWYMVSFGKYVNEVESFADRGSRSAVRVKRELYPLAIAGETKSGISSWAIRQAYATLVLIPNSRQNTIRSRFDIALWTLASNLLLSDEQVFGLWVDCALYSCGQGLNKAAHDHFGKDLNSLSRKELANLVAMVKNPPVFMVGTVRGEQRTEELIEKVDSGTP